MGKQRSHLISSRQYYNAFAPNYEKPRHHGYHLMIDDLESELITHVVKGKDILEVGCGTGLILSRVAPLAKSAVGIDLSPKMLEIAKKRNLHVQEASATHLPFAEAHFDVCYSFKVLSHIPELSLALSEMARVTRPQGKVFIELYNRHSLRYLIRKFRGGYSISEDLNDNQVFFQFYSLKEILACLPNSLYVEKLHGVRLFTIFPRMVQGQGVGSLLIRLERRYRSSVLARFGGFLVLECCKQ